MTNTTKTETANEGPCQCKFCFYATLGPDVCNECLAEFAAEMAAAEASERGE